MLQETYITLILLRDWFREKISTNSVIEGIIKKMIFENSKTVLGIQSLDVEKVMLAFEYLSKKAG